MKSTQQFLRRAKARFLCWLLPIIACAVLFRATPQTPSAGKAARGHINHVVIIVQENRTFDNIFGGFPAGIEGLPPVKPFPGADSTIPTEIAPLMKPQQFGGPPSINASHNVWQCLSASGFSSDAWKSLNGSNCNGTYHGSNMSANPFNYLDPELRKSYWDVATKYVLGDRFFAITSTSSFPGHQYIVADQSSDADGDTVADQPYADKDGSWQAGLGCVDGHVKVRVPRLGADGYLQDVTRSLDGECYTNKTLIDLLMNRPKPVSWKHYTTLQYDSATGKYDQRGVFDGFINSSKWYKATSDWPTSMNDLKKDVAAAPLSQVTWVKPPCIALSDHPNGASTNNAANWVASVVNWIGASSSWGETVIFVVWDDWGGFYDHAIPPATRQWDKLGPGLRTPFLVISPYGANGTVVHQPADYASILKFIEDLYGLDHLTPIDQNATDLSPFFDFSHARPFTPVYVKDSFTPSMCPSTGFDVERIDR